MMRQIVLFDTESVHADMLPMSYTRPVAAFRVGIRTLREQWEEIMPGEYFYRPVWFQRDKFGMPPADADDLLFVAGNLMPREETAALLESLKPGEAAVCGDEVVAYRGSEAGLEAGGFASTVVIPQESARILHFPYDIFLENAEALRREYRRLTAGRVSAPLDESNRVIGRPVDDLGNPMIFIEEGAVMEGATINVKEGPVYIGRDAVVMEGACLRGPLALCARAQVKMGARIYGGTTFGPYCKIGGEVQNAVIFGYSNKAHDGYLGNAVVGEWCNLGAGVNASNLKNDYSKIRLWNYPRHTFMRTDLQFCGLIMADHSKAGINCMFNTATVVGVGVNLHGAGFPRVFIPSFQEGSPAGGMTDVPLKKFYQIAERVMGRRGLTLTDADRRIYERVYEVASQYKAPKSTEK